MITDPIPMEAVDSSSLAGIGYREAGLTLAVQFKDGTIVHYAPVPLDDARALYSASSRGRYYASHIKGRYPGRRMTGPCPKCGDEGWLGAFCADCGCDRYGEKRMF